MPSLGRALASNNVDLDRWDLTRLKRYEKDSSTYESEKKAFLMQISSILDSWNNPQTKSGKEQNQSEYLMLRDVLAVYLSRATGKNISSGFNNFIIAIAEGKKSEVADEIKSIAKIDEKLAEILWEKLIEEGYVEGSESSESGYLGAAEK